MPEYRLLEGGAATSGLGSLFHTPAFFHLHKRDGARYFEWARDGQVAACVHFTPDDDGLWRSPARGTFGGYAARPDLHIDERFAFHDAVEARLQALGARRLEILLAPLAHDAAAFSTETYLLRARGFRITQCDLNQHLVVDTRPLAERMSYGNQKRLRKCGREGLLTGPLPITALPEVHATLSANRAAKGLAMSMSLPDLQTMAERFPAAMSLFACRDADRLIAAALCLRLSADVLYVFYWGDLPGHEAFSPVVPLAAAIYGHCQQAGIRLLDVGASTLDIAPNFGLLQFKRGLGFTESLKLRMHKEL